MKKGQLTVFIILGIILVLAIGVLFVFQAQQQELPEDIIVPPDVKPVYNFVTACAEDIATRGVRLLGTQGGFVEVPAEIRRDPDAHLQVDENGAFLLPFWYFDGLDRAPSLDFMQAEISRYVIERLPECIDNFNAFEDQFDVKIEGALQARTIFAEDQVIVRLTWPLEISKSGRTTAHEDFITTVPVRVRQMWELARATLDFENKNEWFENFTIDLYAADPEVPTDGLTAECDVKRWRLNDIRDRVQRVLYYNIPRIRIENTDFIPFTEPVRNYERLQRFTADDIHEGVEPEHTPIDAYEFHQMTFNVGTPPSDLKAAFEYLPDWGMRLSGEPNDGGTLTSNVVRGQDLLPFLCMNQWHFVYNIIYPVRLTIRDEQAFAGNGFTFNMAFPVIINQNEGERLAFGIRKFTTTSFDVDFCANKGDDVVDIRAIGVEPDILLATELDNVTINYECFKQFCELGATTADDGLYRLRTALPEGCTNPFITAEKEGYLPAKAQLTTNQLDINLKRLNTLNYTVLKHAYTDTGFGIGEPLGLSEQARILLIAKESDVPFDQALDSQNDTSIDFISEETAYDLSILLTKTDIFSGEETLTGGYVNNNYIVDAGIAGEVIFHVFEMRPFPSSDTQQQELARVLYGESYQEELAPDFS